MSELSDVQKGDLARLWPRHMPDSDDPSSANNNTTTRIGDVAIDTELVGFAARLFSFWRASVVPTTTTTTRRTSPWTAERRDEDSPFASSSTTSDAVRVVRELLLRDDGESGEPRLRHDRSVVPIHVGRLRRDLAAFERRANHDDDRDHDHENDFAAYLHHRPDRAVAALECSVGLTMGALYREAAAARRRRRSATTGGANDDDDDDDERSVVDAVHQATSDARFVVRLYLENDGAPFSATRIADVKTHSAHRLVFVRGHVTKACTKRLRVVSAEFSCPKCKSTFPFRFREGRYNVPHRCPATPKCRSQRFALLRHTADYEDFQELRLQQTQDEYADRSEPSTRTPKTLEVQVVGTDMVDRCRAGDVVDVVGVVGAVNTALRAGRRGKGALETSTYQLYLRANSVRAVDQQQSSSTTTSSDERGGPGTDDATNDDDAANPRKRRRRDAAAANKERRTTAFTAEQMRRIIKLAQADPKVGSLPTRRSFPFDLLVHSLCPAIVGHHCVKAGLLLALLGGTPPSNAHRHAKGGNGDPNPIRSNIHVLVVGDPGMGKSQMLLAVSKIAKRSVYVGGNTSSSAGLTVSLTKEPGGNVGIEAGALVLADRGVCCIDEFDKATHRHHLDGLLEAMEQQRVSIAKGGIVASMPCRCSVVAAGNPRQGHYDMNRSVAENLNMESPLLSRFDLVFILRDRNDRKQDSAITTNLMGLYSGGDRHRDRHHHDNNNDDNDNADRVYSEHHVPLEERLDWVKSFQKQALPADVVVDYVSYARQYCFPKLTPEACTVLKEYFLRLRDARQRADRGQRRRRDGPSSVPITTRQLEALIRLSQARARACLRPHVLVEDAVDVVDLMNRSVRQVHTDERGNIDKSRGGAGGTGRRRAKRELVEALRRYARERRDDGDDDDDDTLTKDDVLHVARSIGAPLDNFSGTLDDLRSAGELLLVSRDAYRLPYDK